MIDPKIRKFIESQSDRVKGFEKIGMPKKGDQIMIVSDESFNALTFLMYITKNDKQIDELILSFYSFNMKAMEFLEMLIDQNVVKKLYFQISDLRKYGSDAQIPRKLSNMIKKFGSDRIAGSFINSHAKVMICNTNNNFYVIEGSGNISSKSTGEEQYLIEESEPSYNFHKEWIINNIKNQVIK